MGKFKRVTDIIYNYVRKSKILKGDGTGITSLPSSKRVEQGMEDVFQRLREGGYNPVTADKAIKSEADVLRILKEIDAKEQAKLRAAKRQKEMNDAVQEVMDKMATGKQLNPLDKQKLESSGFKVDASKDMFKGFEPKVIPGGKTLDMSKYSNKMLNDLAEEGNKLQKELAELDRTGSSKLPYREFQSKSRRLDEINEILTEAQKMPMDFFPDDFAKGGIVSAVKKLFKKSKSKKSGDKIYGVGGEEIDVADLKKSLGLDEATDKKSMEDLEKKLQMIIGKERTKHAKGGIAAAIKKLQKKFGKDIIQKGKAPKRNEKKKLQDLFREFNRKNKAGGGLAYMLGEPREEMAAGGPALRRLLQFLHQGADKPMKGSEGLKKMKLPKQVKFFAEKQGYNPDQIRINYLEQVLESLKADRKMMRGLDPDAPSEITGKAKSESELIADDIFKNQFLKTTQEGRFEGLTTEMIDSSIMELEGILKNLKTKGRKLNADGGRIGFADGGMSRRTFLKIMAALAAFPVVGKLAKTTKIAKGVKPIVTPTAEMPEHFPKLVEKIIREGQVVKKDFVKKTGDVTTYKHPDRPDIELTIEGDGNRIQLDFDTDQGMKGGYEFKKGVADEVNPRPPNDFEAGEVKYRMSPDGESYTKDFELGIDTGTENLDEFVGIGKQKTSKSKVNLPESGDDFADGGLAGLLGE